MSMSRVLRITIVFALIVVCGAALWHGSVVHFATDSTGRLVAPLVVRLRRVAAVAGAFISRADLARENTDLRAQIVRTQADAARLDTLTKENDFFRGALEFQKQRAVKPIFASVFSFSTEGGVREMTMNVGSHDGVQANDIVVTAQGALLGAVLQVFPRHAVIQVIGGPSLEVTGRLLGSDVSGLVRWDAARGLIFDLVQKDEQVTEGQVVVTSGNDQFPAGLVIGTVRSVDDDSTASFRTIHITPTVSAQFDGSVLILAQ